MRLQQYLNEKYINSVKTFNNDFFDVFINPSKKEMKEVISNSDYGIRYIIDFKRKKFYMFDGALFHERVMSDVKELPSFNEFWYQEKFGDFIFTGSIIGNEYESDYLALLHRKPEIIDILMSHDWNWLKKYINVDKLKNIINNT